MKKLKQNWIRILVSTMFLLLIIGVEVFAQTASPTPTPTPAPASSASSIWTWLMSNKMDVAACVYWILDVVVLVAPGLAGNGLLHQLTIWAAALSGQSGGQGAKS